MLVYLHDNDRRLDYSVDSRNKYLFHMSSHHDNNLHLVGLLHVHDVKNDEEDLQMSAAWHQYKYWNKVWSYRYNNLHLVVVLHAVDDDEEEFQMLVRSQHKGQDPG
jgi:hypothetical protein